jgi:hypothetical protein
MTAGPQFVRRRLQGRDIVNGKECVAITASIVSHSCSSTATPAEPEPSWDTQRRSWNAPHELAKISSILG